MSEEKEITENELPKEQAIPVFTKQQLLNASRYREKRDLLQALLEEGKSYSFEETETILKRYMKGKVK